MSFSASGFPDFVIMSSETSAFGHGCQAIAPSFDHRAHWQFLAGDKHLLDVDLWSFSGGARRRARRPQEDIRRAERQNRDRPHNDQPPIHESRPFALTRHLQDLDIVIVKVRLI